MKQTEYTLSGHRFGGSLRFALISDLHGQDPSEAIEALLREQPDYILLSGDIFERLNGAKDTVHENALRLLREAARVAPTFYSTGNHEDGRCRSWSGKWKHTVRAREYHVRDLAAIEATGAVLLNDRFVLKDQIAFGGLSSGLICEGQRPCIDWLGDFCKLECPKVLLCHHPEYYEPYLRELPIDLLVSGHAHGGQWRFLSRGVFAPGQGIFPKYTSGVHDDRFVISTGLKKSGRIPRIFNEPEIVFIHA